MPKPGQSKIPSVPAFFQRLCIDTFVVHDGRNGKELDRCSAKKTCPTSLLTKWSLKDHEILASDYDLAMKTLHFASREEIQLLIKEKFNKDTIPANWLCQVIAGVLVKHAPNDFSEYYNLLQIKEHSFTEEQKEDFTHKFEATLRKVRSERASGETVALQRDATTENCFAFTPEVDVNGMKGLNENIDETHQAQETDCDFQYAGNGNQYLEPSGETWQEDSSVIMIPNSSSLAENDKDEEVLMESSEISEEEVDDCDQNQGAGRSYEGFRSQNEYTELKSHPPVEESYSCSVFGAGSLEQNNLVTWNHVDEITQWSPDHFHGSDGLTNSSFDNSLGRVIIDEFMEGCDEEGEIKEISQFDGTLELSSEESMDAPSMEITKTVAADGFDISGSLGDPSFNFSYSQEDTERRGPFYVIK